MASKRDIESADGDAEAVGGHVARPRKKLRAFTEEDMKLARIYEDLASDDETNRLKAAVDLIKTYGALIHVSNDNEAEANAKSVRLQKVDIRLLRGLCSNRKSARIGFSLALTEVLRLKFGGQSGSVEMRADEVAHYLKFVEEHTHPDNYSSAQVKLSK